MLPRNRSSSDRVTARSYRLLRKAVVTVSLVCPGALQWALARREIVGLFSPGSFPAEQHQKVIQEPLSSPSSCPSSAQSEVQSVSSLLTSSIRNYGKHSDQSSSSSPLPPPEALCLNALKTINQNIELYADKVWWRVWCLDGAAKGAAAAAAAAVDGGGDGAMPTARKRSGGSLFERTQSYFESRRQHQQSGVAGGGGDGSGVNTKRYLRSSAIEGSKVLQDAFLARQLARLERQKKEKGTCSTAEDFADSHMQVQQQQQATRESDNDTWASRGQRDVDVVVRPTRNNFDSLWRTGIFRMCLCAGGIFHKVAEVDRPQSKTERFRLEAQQRLDAAKNDDTNSPKQSAKITKQQHISSSHVMNQFAHLLPAGHSSSAAFNPVQVLAADVYLRAFHAVKFYSFLSRLSSQIAHHAPFEDGPALQKMLDTAVAPEIDASVLSLHPASSSSSSLSSPPLPKAAATPENINSFTQLRAETESLNAALLAVLDKQRQSAEQLEAEMTAAQSQLDAAQMVRVVAHVVECVLEYCNECCSRPSSSSGTRRREQQQQPTKQQQNEGEETERERLYRDEVSALIQGARKHFVGGARTRQGHPKQMVSRRHAGGSKDGGDRTHLLSNKERQVLLTRSLLPILDDEGGGVGDVAAAASSSSSSSSSSSPSATTMSSALQLPMLSQRLSLHAALFLICGVFSRLGLPWRTFKPNPDDSATFSGRIASRGFGGHHYRPSPMTAASSRSTGAPAGFGAAPPPPPPPPPPYLSSATTSRQRFTFEQLQQRVEEAEENEEDLVIDEREVEELMGAAGDGGPEDDNPLFHDDDGLEAAVGIDDNNGGGDDNFAALDIEAEGAAPPHYIELVLSGQVEAGGGQQHQQAVERAAAASQEQNNEEMERHVAAAAAAASSSSSSKKLRAFPLKIELYRSSPEDPNIYGFIVAPEELSASVKKSLILQYSLLGSFPTPRHEKAYLDQAVSSAMSRQQTRSKDPVLGLTAHLLHVNLTKNEILAFGGEGEGSAAVGGGIPGATPMMKPASASGGVLGLDAPSLFEQQQDVEERARRIEALKAATSLWSNILNLF